MPSNVTQRPGSGTTVIDPSPPAESCVVIPASNVASTSARITWTTNEPANGQVEYGPTTSYGGTTGLDSTLLTSHSQDLSGLSPLRWRLLGAS